MQGMKPYTRLSQAEREQVFLLTHEGISIREIGKRLGRTHTTISRELNNRGKLYSPVAAHTDAVTRRHERDKHKLDDPLLQTYIIRKLGEAWSPNRLQEDSRRQDPTPPSVTRRSMLPL